MDYSGWYHNIAAPGHLDGMYNQPPETEVVQNSVDATSVKSDHLRKERLLKCNNLYKKNEMYLFQFLIDDILITTENPLLKEKDLSAPLTALIKFIDFPCFEVKYGEPVVIEGFSSNKIVKGISCLFSTTALQLVNSLMKTPVAVNIFRIINESYESDPSSKAGHVLIYMDEDFSMTVLRNTEKATTLPINATVKKTCQLHNTFNEPTGDITVYISISCFGKMAFFQFWLSKTTKNQYKYFTVTKTEDDNKKCFKEIKEEECHLLPLIADYENIITLRKADTSDEDKYLYKKKTYHWEKYTKECGCYSGTDKDYQIQNDIESCKIVNDSLCENNLFSPRGSQLEKERVPQLTQTHCPHNKNICTCIGKCNCKLPETTLQLADLLSKARQTVCCTCLGNCTCYTQGPASSSLQLPVSSPRSKDVYGNNCAARQPLCPFNKDVCVCSGKCACTLPETTHSFLNKPHTTYRLDNYNVCPFNKDICKCSGECHCEISTGITKKFVNQKQPALSSTAQHDGSLYYSSLPLPERSKATFKTDVAESNFKFIPKDGTNLKNFQARSDACPCPFKIGCPFC